MTDHHHPSSPRPPHHPFVETYVNNHQPTTIIAVMCAFVAFWSFWNFMFSLEWGYIALGIISAVPFSYYMMKLEEFCWRQVKAEHAKVIRRASTMPRRRTPSRSTRPVRRTAGRSPAARTASRHRHERLTQAETERLAYNQYA
jgi:hypothetical protein